MAVKVWPNVEHEDPTTYNTGSKWFIDEPELLHVIDGNGKHIAAYARGQWSSVATD